MFLHENFPEDTVDFWNAECITEIILKVKRLRTEEVKVKQS